MTEKLNLQLFGVLEDESADTVQELLRDYPGMTGQEAVLIAILAELRRMNDNLGCLETKLTDMGRLAECINEFGQLSVTGTMTTFEG